MFIAAMGKMDAVGVVSLMSLSPLPDVHPKLQIASNQSVFGKCKA